MPVYVLPQSQFSSSLPPVRRKHTASVEVTVGVVTLSFTLICLISILSFASLRHTSKIQAAGYLIKKQEQEKSSLSNTNKSLTMEIAKRRSLNNLEQSSQVSKMLIVSSPVIITAPRDLALK